MNQPTARQVDKLYHAISHQLTTQPDYWTCRSRTYFLELLFLIDHLVWNLDSSHDISVLEDGDIEKILNYLHLNYQHKITIHDLSNMFHLNRTSLNERFQRIIGMPVITYLIDLRVRLASTILRNTNLPVAEVAEQTGFSNLSHFIKSFRHCTGLTPTEYRKNYDD